MAGFDALLSLGIAIAYTFAAPVLRALGPKGVYGLGAVSAGIAAVLLLPLLRLRRPSTQAELEAETPPHDTSEEIVAPFDIV